MGRNLALLRQLGLKGSDSSDSEDDVLPRTMTMEDDSKKPIEVMDMSIVKPSAQLNIVNNNQQDKKKKFSIWSDVLMEQQLSDDLANNVKLRTNKYDRDVENYNYRRGLKCVSPKKKTQTKLEQKSKLKRGQPPKTLSYNVKVFKPGDVKPTSAQRILPAAAKGLVVNASASAGVQKKKKKKNKKRKKNKEQSVRSQEEIIAHQIKTKLREPKLHLIRKTVEAIGCDEALKVCNEALDVESAGGMMTVDGSRRRTPGGVFFTLIRNSTKIASEQKDLIFGAEKEFLEQRKRLKRKFEKRSGNHNQPNTTSESRENEGSHLVLESSAKVELVEALVKNFSISNNDEAKDLEDGEIA